jgi:RimJ/RimL family protein N-acetyltransferase
MNVSTARQVAVRPLREEDRALLEQMYDAFDPPGAAMGLPPRDALRRREWLAELRKGLNLLAFVDGALAGHLALVWNGRMAELAAFVHQDFRRLGVGTALARAAVDAARKMDLLAIWVLIDSSNVAARRGLLKFGFRTAWEDLQEAQMIFPLKEEAKAA